MYFDISDSGQIQVCVFCGDCWCDWVWAYAAAGRYRPRQGALYDQVIEGGGRSERVVSPVVGFSMVGQGRKAEAEGNGGKSIRR